MRLQTQSVIRFESIEGIREFQRKMMELQNLKYQNPLSNTKYDSIVRLKISERRKRIIKLAKLGLTQKEIASNPRINVSVRQVRRDIKAIREHLDIG